MKIVRASKRVDKAIDAILDLQQDYGDEVTKAGVGYDVGRVADMLNHISTAIDAIVEGK